MKGKTRCRNHGGRSSGPKSQAVRNELAAEKFEHGAFAKLTTYEQMLGINMKEAFIAAHGQSTDLSPELAFLRGKLAIMEQKYKKGLVTIDIVQNLSGQIRKMSATQHMIKPGGDVSGELTVNIKLAGAKIKPVVVEEDDSTPKVEEKDPADEYEEP